MIYGLFGVPMFVGCCAILWIYWDRLKKPKKKIFISADCWLCVFDLLPPRQLGLGIALISHRFDYYVDEHFKIRKRTLALIRIHSKNGKDGTKEMEILNSHWKPLPIPQIQMPRKVIGFECIEIKYIDQNVIAFLGRFRQLFASFCPINLFIHTESDRILDFILRNIWPMIAGNICGLIFYDFIFRRFRQFVPSFLNECPFLRVVNSFDDLFTEFLADDNAMASDGQSVAKWLFTALPDNNVPKMFKCWMNNDDGKWPLKIETFKATFASASSPVNFIVSISFRSSFAVSDLPFVLTNELTREQLELKRINNSHRFLLIRSPIARDASKWTKWEEEAIGWQIYDQWNTIEIRIYDERDIGERLLDETPDPSDQQQK